MSNCTNCGQPLKENAKFCTNCGQQIKSKIKLSIVERKEFNENSKKQTNKKNTSEDNQESIAEFIPSVKQSNSLLKSKLLGFYIILAIAIHTLGNGSEQIIGMSIYSLVITVVIALRFNKENTFNWVVNLLLVLQFVFILSIVIPEKDVLFANLISSVATLLFGTMLLVIGLMVLIGNRSKS